METLQTKAAEIKERRRLALQEEEEKRIAEELKTLNYARDEFEKRFSEVLPLLKASGVEYDVIIDYEYEVSYIKFSHANGNIAEMDFINSSRYRYCHLPRDRNPYDKYPVEDFVVWLNDSIFGTEPSPRAVFESNLLKPNARKTFTANLVSETTTTAIPLGKHDSTMDLYIHLDSCWEEGSATIEWDIPTLEVTENIGVAWEYGIVTSYDGIMGHLPIEAVDLLQSVGLSVEASLYQK